MIAGTTLEVSGRTFPTYVVQHHLSIHPGSHINTATLTAHGLQQVQPVRAEETHLEPSICRDPQPVARAAEVAAHITRAHNVRCGNGEMYWMKHDATRGQQT
jgi:hypothetical protein